MHSDRELATRVVLGKDQQAFCQLVERHQAAIRAFLRRLLAGDHAAADDLAQETFLAAYSKLHTWKGDAQLSTWLHSIAYRKFLERLRREKRFDLMAEVPEPATSGRLPAEDEILAQQLMGLLDATDRACLTLSYAVGLLHEEIAEIVDLPVGTVKSRVHRAKLKLQDWLSDHDHSIQDSGPQAGLEQSHAR